MQVWEVAGMMVQMVVGMTVVAEMIHWNMLLPQRILLTVPEVQKPLQRDYGKRDCLQLQTVVESR